MFILRVLEVVAFAGGGAATFGVEEMLELISSMVLFLERGEYCNKP